MAEKLPAKVEEQVKEVVRRKRPDLSVKQTVQLEEGDNRKYIAHDLFFMKLQKVDMSNPQEVEERSMLYVEKCAENDMKPSVAGYALALGIDRRTLWQYREGQLGKSREVADTLKKMVDFLTSQMENYMQNGKINPVSGIFLMKNNMGYQDKQEVVLTPNAPLGEETTPAELQEKYIDVVGEAESEQK